MNIKRFNESKSIITFQQLLDMIDKNEIDVVNTDKESLGEYLERLSRYNKGKDFFKEPIMNVRQRDNLIEVGEDFCIVLNESGEPIALIGEYELCNSFIFNNVVICPGHDSITCYDLTDGSHKTTHIR